ncbi:DUF2125 domain-containing protein [Paracoccus sp. (in: a-proteobacteria)]|uniref:DUF2125 domain-containing protein n=1 Tax=Paracoccus sp. TaxID=267 RepID=UPI002AFFE985|nr:DUF2125 domain-containing protein [Paracoccus sp. (in: a-proteobacteria)]
MRRMLALLVALALVLGGLWLGGESLLAQQMRRLAAEQPMTDLGAVQELRDPGRFGVRALGLELQTDAGRLGLQQAELWLSPLHPTTLRFALAPKGMLDAGSGPLELGLGDAMAQLRFSPWNGLGLAAAQIKAGPLTIAGTELATAVRINAVGRTLDQDAPSGAAVSYDLNLTLHGLDPGAFATLSLPGPLNATATGRIWLDALPQPWTLTPDLAPLPVGLRLDEVELQLGGLQARIIGRVQADAQGRAEGRLVLYTTDAKPLLQAAASAGLIPSRVVRLAGTMLKTISDLPLPDEDGQRFPPPAEGELRLPLRFADGKVSLGPLTLGPAPVFPRR